MPPVFSGVFFRVMRRMAFLAVAALFASVSALAAKTYFKGACDRDALSYKPGEAMVFSVSLMEDGKPKGGQKVKYVRRGDDGETDSGEFVSDADKPFVYRTSIDRPGYVHLKMEAVGDDGKPVGGAEKFDGGACADFDKIAPSAPEPKDFDRYWRGRKRALKKVPIKAELTPLPGKSKDGIDVYEIKIDCLGDSVRVYLSVPKNAAEKSLPAHAVFQGYSVADMHYWPVADAVTVFVSPHSMDMGKDAAYYDALKKGRLAGFGFEKELASPKDSYFDGMILRGLRALEYLRSRPEWNGKDLSVSGGSMGGFQAIAMAALDPKVTKCKSSITWMCDLGGADAGRLGGWLPKYLPNRAYFDSANLGRRIKCPVEIDAGLGDYTCPPSGVTALYNGISAPKKITFTQGRTHGYTPPDSPARYSRSGGGQK